MISGVSSGPVQAAFFYATSSSDAKTLAASGQKVFAGSVSTSGGAFSASLTNLDPATTYYYVASVTVGGQSYYGSVNSFTSEKKLELIITHDATDIKATSVLLSGKANIPSDFTYVQLGVILSKESNAPIENSTVFNSQVFDGNNNFIVHADGLSSNTTYYYKAFIWK